MEYRELVAAYQDLERTSATLAKTERLAELLGTAGPDQLPRLVTLIRGTVFPAWESSELGVSSSLTKAAIRKATGISETRIEDRWRETGDLGDAAAAAVEDRKQQTLLSETLTVDAVYTTLQDTASYEGEGSQQRRIDAIASLLSSASPAEAKYIVRTVVGAMRLGVGEGILRDAIAMAFLDGSNEASTEVERAYHVTNDFRVVAETARRDGRGGLSNLNVQLFRPLKVMLAHKADSVDAGRTEVADSREELLAEIKYDGIRTQIHKEGDRVEVYTRRLEVITDQFPEIAAAAEKLPRGEFIIEGEIVGYDPETERPVPFQELSRRVKRKYDIDELQEQLPVKVHLFDLLYEEGTTYLDTPLQTRLARLEDLLPTDLQSLQRAEFIRHPESEALETFYETALADGHEGIMTKNLAATYQPGTRVGYMMKVKPTMEPLDLVVVRAKWSEGRRSDFLGRIYLGCYDETTDEFKEVGRMATGFTDDELGELTNRLTPLITAESGREVQVQPEVIVEVEYEEIQQSPEYESGFALRFPRFAGFRDDLTLEDIDTLDRVSTLYRDQ